ncbi:hypothetical protein DFO70_108233 [Cytobacillus firmus]|uniref:Uncharacterized protein n=2 Tax=Cytobacillus TaxID=2675230 RepID=A0A366JTM0_CYTFI|nr:hypothetical protein DFO70_108233 [Cytobacillus firmus]TDX41644.1 hypothetical protein DFO72_108233 [Cytobacillus oceanisediminis]
MFRSLNSEESEALIKHLEKARKKPMSFFVKYLEFEINNIRRIKK